MKTHVNKRPFQCSDCKRSFSKEISLQTHMTIHFKSNASLDEDNTIEMQKIDIITSDNETKSQQETTSSPVVQKLNTDQINKVQSELTKEDHTHNHVSFKIPVWEPTMENIDFNLKNIRDVSNSINIHDNYGYNFNLMFSPKTPLLSPISKLSRHIKVLRNEGRDGMSKDEAHSIILNFISLVKTEQEFKLVNFTNQYINRIDNTEKVPLEQFSNIIEVFKKEEEVSFTNLSNLSAIVHKPEPFYRTVISPVRIASEYSPFGDSRIGFCNIPYSPLVTGNNSMTPLSYMNKFAVPNNPAKATSFSDYIQTLRLKTSKDSY